MMRDIGLTILLLFILLLLLPLLLLLLHTVFIALFLPPWTTFFSFSSKCRRAQFCAVGGG
jgi:hypothetical protein